MAKGREKEKDLPGVYGCKKGLRLVAQRGVFYKRFDRDGKFSKKRDGGKQCGTFDKERLWESPKGNGRVAGMGYHGRKSKAAVFRRKRDGANGARG